MEITAKKVWTVFLSWVAEEMFFNIMGTRELMPEILKAFIPTIGATAATLAIIGSISLFREWDAALATRAISELESLVESGESFYRDVRRVRTPPRTESTRFAVLATKYIWWMTKPGDDLPSSLGDDFLNKAAHRAEILRTYGYFRGRWVIYRESKIPE